MTIHELTTDLLEKHHQMNCLLDVTQLINNNSASSLLFEKYFEYLRNIIGIEKSILYIPRSQKWYGLIDEDQEALLHLFEQYNSSSTEQNVIHLPEPVEGYYSMLIVYHKHQPIAFSLLSEFRRKPGEDKSKFVITLVNIIAVAIENKLLFKQQIDQEKYQKELDLASEMQQMLIPKSLPTNKKFDASAIYRPQLTVGGDYFDFIVQDNDRFLMCIADISGKGLAAALMMSNFQASLHSVYKRVTSLKQLVETLNESVYHLTLGEKILSFFVAEVNTKKRTIHYVNAGHHPPLLFNNKGEQTKLIKGTTLLGVFDRLPPIEEGFVQLDKGPSLILSFTDGLTDLTNHKGEYFPEEKITEIALSNFSQSAALVNNAIMAEIEAFAVDKEYPDDIAVLTCKIM